MVENEWLIILGVCVCVLSHAKTATNRKPDCTVKRSHLRYLICGVHVRPRLDQNLQRFDCEVSGIVSGRYVYDENVSRHNKMDEKSPCCMLYIMEVSAREKHPQSHSCDVNQVLTVPPECSDVQLPTV